MAKFLLVLLFLVGCGTQIRNDFSGWVQDDGKVRVLATTAFVADLVRRVGGDRVKVISMVGENQDPHSYEVVKGDGEKFNYADVVFANGLFLEHSGSMQYQLKHHKNVVFLGDELLKKYPDRIIYVDGQLDPHIWMNISLWSECIDFVLKKLIEIDPENSKIYKERGDLTKAEFISEDAQISKRMQSIPAEKRYLVTSHDAFNYFVKRYFATSTEIEDDSWRVRVNALQGLAPDEQISVMQIKEIVDHVCKYHIQVIFPENNLSSDSLEKVKEACAHRGVEIHLAKSTLYGDTLGGKGYLEMLEYNAGVLESNLQ